MRRVRVIVSGVSMMALSVFGMLLLPGHAAAFSGDGAGTTSDPYKITNCTELGEINSDLAAKYIQDGNVECGGTTIDMLGDSSAPFTGTYDGKGYEISHFSVVAPGSSDVGLFGSTDHATITDVHVRNANISGDDNTGAVVGYAGLSTLSYLSAETVTVLGGGDNVGGLVGRLGGSSLSKSYAKSVTISGAGDKTGGVVGALVGPSSIDKSYTKGVAINANNTVGGVIGSIDIGPIYASQLYADTTFSAAGSDVIGHVTTGYGASTSSYVDVQGSGSTYTGTSSVGPFDSWDFSNDWYVRPSDFPGIRPRTMPQILCNAPSVTNTTMSASCYTAPALDGNPQWELKYGFSDDTDRTALTTQSGTMFNVTVSNVVPGSDYDLQFRWVDAIGTSQWSRVQLTTSGSSDSDNDGISNELESKGPNGGDADNDGTPDYQQANVTSLKSSISGKYVVLKTACADNFNTQIGLESSQQPDAAYDYEAGLVGFVIRGCTPGVVTSVTLFYYGSYPDTANYIARKANNGVYKTVPGAVFANTIIGSQPVLKMAYTITDGGVLDDDGIADGNIVDPVGFTRAIVSPATTNASHSNGTLADTGVNPMLPSIGSLLVVGLALATRLRLFRKLQPTMLEAGRKRLR